MVKVPCLNCGDHVLVTEWSLHESICPGGPSTSSMASDQKMSIMIEDSDAEPDHSPLCATTREAPVKFTKQADLNQTNSSPVITDSITENGKSMNISKSSLLFCHVLGLSMKQRVNKNKCVY